MLNPLPILGMYFQRRVAIGIVVNLTFLNTFFLRITAVDIKYWFFISCTQYIKYESHSNNNNKKYLYYQ